MDQQKGNTSRDCRVKGNTHRRQALAITASILVLATAALLFVPKRSNTILAVVIVVGALRLGITIAQMQRQRSDPRPPRDSPF